MTPELQAFLAFQTTSAARKTADGIELERLREIAKNEVPVEKLPEGWIWRWDIDSWAAECGVLSVYLDSHNLAIAVDYDETACAPVAVVLAVLHANGCLT